MLFRILRAISVYSPAIGYVQGFNFIAGTLLKFIKVEETVFLIFISILEDLQL
jgi:hypothetical protein